MEVYLVRHGITDWNVQGRLQGREDIPLNEEGRAQAVQCGEALGAAGFSIIYSSPLSRAIDTAAQISVYHTRKVTVDPELIERDYGRLTGMTKPQREQWEARGLPTGMEPWKLLAGRAMAAVDSCAREHGADERVALVSHGAWINAVLAVLSRHEIGTGKTELKNACISVLKREEKSWKILCYNLSPGEYAQWAAGRQPANP